MASDAAAPAGGEVRGSGFALRLPAGWIDRSVVTLVAGERDIEGGAPSLVVTRDPVPPGTDARGLARLNHRALTAGGAEGLRVVDTWRGEVAGVPAIVRTYRWTYGVSAMRQRLWSFVAGGVGFTITASAPDHRFDEFAPAFDEAVAGFRLDG